MFWTKRVVIGDGERGLVYRNRQFAGVLAPGVYRWFDPFKRVEVTVHNIARAEYAGSDADALIATLGERLGETFVLANLGMDEVGLVLKNGKLEDVLAPGTRKLYWKGLIAVEAQAVSLTNGLDV
ncbi:MAG TPA: slipin family protein, partial [Xanthomonadaceae bacterium]|nr:slipin family protein [Xanthomonadaceae bacterium]